MKDNLQALGSVRPLTDFEDDDPYPTMSWIEISRCNCSNHETRGTVIQNYESDSATESMEPIQEDSEFEESDGACTPEEAALTEDHTQEEQFTEPFGLRGTSFHDPFKNALRKYKLLKLSGNEPRLTLSFEPVNKRDENAIVVMAKFNDTVEPIGYVPGERVQKIMNACKDEQITSIKMSLITRMYNYCVGRQLYTATVSISKIGGRWPANSSDYSYNCIF